MQAMRGPVAPSGFMFVATVIVACTPTVESQSSSAANPSAWSSNESDGASTPPQTTPNKPTRWEHMDALKSFRKTGTRFRSQHLQGDQDAEIFVNEAAATYPLLGPSRQPSAGAIVVEALYASNAPNQTDAAMYFAMVKRTSAKGSEWEYAVISSAGMIERQGALTLCARCHAEAPSDHLFGRPH